MLGSILSSGGQFPIVETNLYFHFPHACLNLCHLFKPMPVLSFSIYSSPMILLINESWSLSTHLTSSSLFFLGVFATSFSLSSTQSSTHLSSTQSSTPCHPLILLVIHLPTYRFNIQVPRSSFPPNTLNYVQKCFIFYLTCVSFQPHPLSTSSHNLYLYSQLPVYFSSTTSCIFHSLPDSLNNKLQSYFPSVLLPVFSPSFHVLPLPKNLYPHLIHQYPLL